MAYPRIFAACALALATLAPSTPAQPAPPAPSPSDPPTPDARPMLPPPIPRNVQTVFLKNATAPNEITDIQATVRNMLPQVRMYADTAQNAFSISATDEDMQQALKLIAALDQPRKVYRLTYTVGGHQFVVLAAAGQRSSFKQGSRVPIVTGATANNNSGLVSQVQYQDIGLNITATVGGSADNLSLQTKVEQMSLSGDKPATSVLDPEIHQTILDVVSVLTPGKPLVLGSLESSGGSSQQIAVTAELVR